MSTKFILIASGICQACSHSTEIFQNPVRGSGFGVRGSGFRVLFLWATGFNPFIFLIFPSTSLSSSTIWWCLLHYFSVATVTIYDNVTRQQNFKSCSRWPTIFFFYLHELLKNMILYPDEGRAVQTWLEMAHSLEHFISSGKLCRRMGGTTIYLILYKY